MWHSFRPYQSCSCYIQLKEVGLEIFATLKKDMRQTGRFLRKVRGAAVGQAPYELLNDSEALSRIYQDLRRRMDSSNNWQQLSQVKKEQVEYGTGLNTDYKPSDIPHETSSAIELDSTELIIRPDSSNWGVAKYFSSDDDEDAASIVKKYDDDGENERNSAGEVVALNPCMCKKSKCLKLYCECFSKERYCFGCYCGGCSNTPRNDAERERMISIIKTRNPTAFTPRVKTTVECKCKRSACLKKYCECFLHGAFCTETCQCKACKNVEPQKHNLEGKSDMIFGESIEKYGDGTTLANSPCTFSPFSRTAIKNKAIASESAVSKISTEKLRTTISSSVSKQASLVLDRSGATQTRSNEEQEVVSQKKCLSNEDADREGAQQSNDRAGVQPLKLTCPHCLKVFTLKSAKTAAANFAHHARACEKKNANLRIDTNGESMDRSGGCKTRSLDSQK